MAAIAIAPTMFRTMHITPIIVKAITLTTGDWINLTGIEGIWGGLFEVASSTNNTAPGAVAWEYGVALVNGLVTSTTATSVIIDGANAHATITRQVPFYGKCKSGEIIEVTGDSAPEDATATWTIRRGCLGTTAAALADNDYIEIMNQVTLASTPVGTVTGIVFPMPSEPMAKLFA